MKLHLSLAVLFIAGSSQCLADEYTEQVKIQISLVKIAAAEDGWEETHEDFYSALDEGESETFELELEEGVDYRVFSACDADCDDLDLHIFDENGNSIGVDTQTDDLPIVAATPAWTGPFALVVTMHSCDDEPCTFGIAVVGQ